MKPTSIRWPKVCLHNCRWYADLTTLTAVLTLSTVRYGKRDVNHAIVRKELRKNRTSLNLLLHDYKMKQDGWVVAHGLRNPVQSVGIIPFTVCPTRGLCLLMVRRKVTVGFMDFVRGKYGVANLHRLKRLIDTMTNEEKQHILSKSYEDLWQIAWGENHCSGGHRLEADQGALLLETIRRGVSVDGVVQTLDSLVAESPTSWIEQEWEFPKGRKNFQEKDLDCAFRETSEETGLPTTMFNVIRNTVPLEEVFIGSNLKSYKYKFYLANVKDPDCDLSNFQRTEISQARWMTADESLAAIRPYHGERLNLVRRVFSLLPTMQLFHVD